MPSKHEDTGSIPVRGAKFTAVRVNPDTLYAGSGLLAYDARHEPS